MKIQLLAVGKTDFSFVDEAVKLYYERIRKYNAFEILYLKDQKKNGSSDTNKMRKKEGEHILQHIKQDDFVVLLDENGKEFTSRHFASYIEHKINMGPKRTVFIIGGAYGFSDDVKERANDKISLSKMTFSHQIVRAIFLEQLYRAFTIMKGEPYHHD